MLVGLYAQQTIEFGDIKNYSVDTNEGGVSTPDGTVGSTYTWSVWTTDATPVDITTASTLTLSYTNSPATNRIQIDWGTTAPGKYTVHVTENNASCIGTEETILVTINATSIPTIKEDNAATCLGTPTDFTITNAPANSKVTFTITGGTSTTTSPVTVDAAGESTITVTPTAGATEIVVTLTSVELSNGVIVPITTTVEAKTQITTVTTSTITFD